LISRASAPDGWRAIRVASFSLMSKSKRGPERRQNKISARTSTTESTGSHTERRRLEDRRRNAYISRLDLCRDLPYGEVEEILEQCPIIPLGTGEVLLEPGQANHNLYFLLTGRLEVRLQSVAAPAHDVIDAGECTGEMSIIDGQPTSAYVVATTTSSVIAIHENIFWSKLARNPQAVRNLSRVLAERMRKRNAATLRALEQEMRLKQLQKELLAAYEIQTGLLPAGPDLLPEIAALDIHARMDVVKSVGGDFYDAFALDEHRVCVAVGDVSGKGMPAALFMIRTLTLLRTELIKMNDLAECMSRFNRALCETNISHMFASLVVLCIDVDTGTADYVNAGHLPLLHAKAHGPFFPRDDSCGLIAGVLQDTVYKVARLELDPGDRLLLYTDGITEMRNPARRFYNLQGLIEFLHELETDSASDLAEAVFDSALEFANGAPPLDDVTVVAIQYRPQG